MKRKVLIALGIVGGLIIIFSVYVLAAVGIDNWVAFLETQKAALDGLKAYFDFLIELFEVTIT